MCARTAQEPGMLPELSSDTSESIRYLGILYYIILYYIKSYYIILYHYYYDDYY